MSRNLDKSRLGVKVQQGNCDCDTLCASPGSYRRCSPINKQPPSCRCKYHQTSNNNSLHNHKDPILQHLGCYLWVLGVIIAKSCATSRA